MIAVRGETYKADVKERIENSDYEWEAPIKFSFWCRPASQMEKKTYRIQKGVNGNSDSIFLISSNLPEDIKPKDKINFMGKEWTVESVGYYFDSSLIVNANILSDEQIIARCPKGVNIQ